LPISLDCPFLIVPSVFSNMYLSCVLCGQRCQYSWIVHSWLSHQFSLTFICPVYCVANVVNISGLSILIALLISLTFPLGHALIFPTDWKNSCYIEISISIDSPRSTLSGLPYFSTRESKICKFNYR
jgi:hypothetical protein